MSKHHDDFRGIEFALEKMKKKEVAQVMPNGHLTIFLRTISSLFKQKVHKKCSGESHLANFFPFNIEVVTFNHLLTANL